MNPRNTWRWMAVAAALFAFIFVSHRYANRNNGGPTAVLPDLKAGAVTSVQVRPGAQPQIRADHTNGLWQLSEPVVYPAQALSIEKLLAELQQLMPARHIGARELRERPNADEEYGLAIPQASLVVEQPGHTARLRVGSKTPPGDQVFLQVVGVEGVFIVDAEFLKYLPTSPDDWRDRTLLDLQGLTLDRLDVTNGAKVFEVRHDAKTKLWRMVYPLQARANTTRIEDALQALQGMRVRRFVADDPKADLEPFGLQPPELELVLGQSTNTLVRLQVGRSPTNDTRLVYARRFGQNAVVAVPKDLLAPWYAPVNDFRDPLLATWSAPVTAVEARGQDNYSVQQQTNGTWRVLPQGFPADAGLVRLLLSALGSMRIVEFTTDVAIAADLPKYGLAAPARQYTLRSAVTSAAGPTNTTLMELSFGTNTADKVFAQRADEPGFICAVRLTELQRLPFAGWQMRERRIWNLPTNDVARVTLRQYGKVRQVVRNGPHEWSLAAGSSGVINDLAVEETVGALCDLTAAAWVASGTPDRARFGLTDNDLTVTLELANGEKASVEFSSETPANLPYASVTLDGAPWVFECPIWIYAYAQRYLSVPPSP